MNSSNDPPDGMHGFRPLDTSPLRKSDIEVDMAFYKHLLTLNAEERKKQLAGKRVNAQAIHQLGNMHDRYSILESFQAALRPEFDPPARTKSLPPSGPAEKSVGPQGDLRAIEKIGGGDQAEVFKIEDGKKQIFAAKSFDTEEQQAGEISRYRLVQETAGYNKHLLQYHENPRDPSGTYFVQSGESSDFEAMIVDFIGPSLRDFTQYLRDMRRDDPHFFEVYVNIIQCLAESLVRAAIHMANTEIAHRDIFPRNVMVNLKTGVFVLGDIGLGRKQLESPRAQWQSREPADSASPFTEMYYLDAAQIVDLLGPFFKPVLSQEEARRRALNQVVVERKTSNTNLAKTSIDRLSHRVGSEGVFEKTGLDFEFLRDRSLDDKRVAEEVKKVCIRGILLDHGGAASFIKKTAIRKEMSDDVIGQIIRERLSELSIAQPHPDYRLYYKAAADYIHKIATIRDRLFSNASMNQLISELSKSEILDNERVSEIATQLLGSLSITKASHPNFDFPAAVAIEVIKEVERVRATLLGHEEALEIMGATETSDELILARAVRVSDALSVSIADFNDRAVVSAVATELMRATLRGDVPQRAPNRVPSRPLADDITARPDALNLFTRVDNLLSTDCSALEREAGRQLAAFNEFNARVRASKIRLSALAMPTLQLDVSDDLARLKMREEDLEQLDKLSAYVGELEAIQEDSEKIRQLGDDINRLVQAKENLEQAEVAQGMGSGAELKVILKQWKEVRMQLAQLEMRQQDIIRLDALKQYVVELTAQKADPKQLENLQQDRMIQEKKVAQIALQLEQAAKLDDLLSALDAERATAAAEKLRAVTGPIDPTMLLRELDIALMRQPAVPQIREKRDALLKRLPNTIKVLRLPIEWGGKQNAATNAQQTTLTNVELASLDLTREEIAVPGWEHKVLKQAIESSGRYGNFQFERGDAYFFLKVTEKAESERSLECAVDLTDADNWQGKYNSAEDMLEQVAIRRFAEANCPDLVQELMRKVNAVHSGTLKVSAIDEAPGPDTRTVVNAPPPLSTVLDGLARGDASRSFGKLLKRASRKFSGTTDQSGSAHSPQRKKSSVKLQDMFRIGRSKSGSGDPSTSAAAIEAQPLSRSFLDQPQVLRDEPGIIFGQDIPNLPEFGTRADYALSAQAESQPDVQNPGNMLGVLGTWERQDIENVERLLPGKKILPSDAISKTSYPGTPLGLGTHGDLFIQLDYGQPQAANTVKVCRMPANAIGSQTFTPGVATTISCLDPNEKDQQKKPLRKRK